MQKDNSIQWDHTHDFGIDNKHNENKVKIVFWLTTVIMVLEITAGTWSGSMALLADGWHMGTHSAAFLIAIFAYSYAKKHRDNKAFSFGTGKVNYLGGFASAVALAIVALMMAIESVQRLIEPQAIQFNEAIFVAIIGLLVNVASVFVLHDDHHHHHHHQGDEHQQEHGHQQNGFQQENSKQKSHQDSPELELSHKQKQQNSHHDHHEHHHDHNLKAAYFHVLADTLTSLLAIVALLTGKYFGWIWMDALMGIVGAGVITRWSYGLIRESSNVLLDKSVSTSAYSAIALAVKEKNQAIISDIHIWKIGASHCAAILSLRTDLSIEPVEYKQILKQHVANLSHISIEINRK